MSKISDLIQNSSICCVCQKICSIKDWVVFDGQTGLCKCRSCCTSKNLSTMTRHEVTIVFDKSKYFQTLYDRRRVIDKK